VAEMLMELDPDIVTVGVSELEGLKVGVIECDGLKVGVVENEPDGDSLDVADIDCAAARCPKSNAAASSSVAT